MTAGKCIHCNVRFVWNDDIRLCDSGCPYCHNPLDYTTITNCFGDIYELTPFQFALKWEERWKKEVNYTK